MKSARIAVVLVISLTACAVEQPKFEPANSSTIPPGESSPVESIDPLTEIYRLAKSLFLKNQEGYLDYAVLYLEQVVTKDPRLEGALTFLGRAYYQQGRYQYALEILKRALAVNKMDEIAWLAIGLTQLRLGEDQRGINSIKAGLTLFAKASKSGYRGFSNWDSNGLVRQAMRRAVLQVARAGLAEKQRTIESCELLFRRIDEEELAQQSESPAKESLEKPRG